MINFVRLQKNLFLLALAFLTRIPIPKPWFQFDRSLLGRIHFYILLVGLIVGLINCIFYYFFIFFFSHTISVVLTLAAGIFITGGYHEDGFADVCDGLGGGDTVEKKLAIMKDSRLGTYGVLGLVILLLTKFATLNELPSVDILKIFTTAHLLSRWSMLPLILSLKYIGKTKETIEFFNGMSLVKLIWISLSAMTGLYLLVENYILPVLGLIIFGVVIEYAFFKKQINGINGDCLGAANQVNEVLVYMAFLIHIPNL